MVAQQGPMRVTRMVEEGGFPLVVAVAAAAVGSKATGVGILALMAAHALFRELVLEVATAMATRAVDARVRPFQRKAGLFRMVELAALPACRRVAIRAFRATFSAMYVIGCMTGYALPGCVLVAIPKVASHACNPDVLVLQRECCLAVVEVDVPPEGGVMTRGAVASKLAFVRFVLLVTVDTATGRVAIGFAGVVATAALERGMCASQRKLRPVVIELGRAELYDVTGASEVLGVTGAALCLRNARELAVEAVRGTDIGCDLLVAVQAQARLAIAVAAIVTARALLLVFLMSDAHLAGHEEDLRVHGIAAPRGQRSQDQCEREQRKTLSLPHEQTS